MEQNSRHEITAKRQGEARERQTEIEICVVEQRDLLATRSSGMSIFDVSSAVKRKKY